VYILSCAGQEVKYISSDYNNEIIAVTDKKGNFTLRGLPDKPVRLTVIKGTAVGSYIVSRNTKFVTIQIAPSE
jgi:hypothetical protein